MGWPLIAARVGAAPAFDMTPDRLLSLGVGQSRPAAPAFARGWAAAECGLFPAASPVLEPRRLVRMGRSSPSTSTLARPIQLPNRDWSVRGRTETADHCPGP